MNEYVIWIGESVHENTLSHHLQVG